MAAKKAAAKKPATRRSSTRARAAAPAPAKCPNCRRPLQEHETLVDGQPCQRCQFEAKYPGRDLDADQKAALEAGVRLSTYVRDAIEHDGSVERERRAGLRAH